MFLFEISFQVVIARNFQRRTLIVFVFAGAVKTCSYNKVKQLLKNRKRRVFKKSAQILRTIFCRELSWCNIFVQNEVCYAIVHN